MQVQKRNNSFESVDFNKITTRLSNLNDSPWVDPIKVAQKVCSSIYDGVSTTELDELSAQISISMSLEHPDYGILASRICISNLHKSTLGDFEKCSEKLFQEKLVSKQYIDIVRKHISRIQEHIDYERDYLFDYFGFKTLTKSYLLQCNGKIIERPQDLWMRVALGIHFDDIESALTTYELISKKYFTHATPTLFNAGSDRPQMSSCFLLEINDDSIAGIYKSLSDCAQISKYAGGIGIHIHKLRATGSNIGKLKNVCTGILPVLRVFNATSRYVNQGGKRPGSVAVYLATDHPDLPKFLELRKNHGDEEERCRDLFYGLWISDLFMKRVRENGMWSFFCPSKINIDLQNLYGEDYENAYILLEERKMYHSQMNAQDLWLAICNAQIETGNPYLLYKDAVNRKTNQQNVGVIKSSNLCTEILQYTSPEETSVCNLASISLPRFVNTESLEFDFDHLHEVVKVITKNLNKVIDINYYPVPEAEFSNKRHRPIGIGVQGLADVYMMLHYPFDSKNASILNMNIFETIYHAALEASCELAKLHGPYETYENSPVHKGILQFDMWEQDENYVFIQNWEHLRNEIKKHGIRNSLLVAPMPTASTSQIMGNNECIEPYTSNIYLRRTLAGEFVVINKHLINHLIQLKLWNTDMKDKIIAHKGSVQHIPEIPEKVKHLYKTAWELSQKCLIDQAADRGKFICQSQSLNLFVAKPSFKILSSMHFYAWNKGLKTGIYYLRTKPAVDPVQFTIAPSLTTSSNSTYNVCETCSA